MVIVIIVFICICFSLYLIAVQLFGYSSRKSDIKLSVIVSLSGQSGSLIFY